MQDKIKNNLTIIGVVLAAIFVVFIWPNESTWDGDGSINVFPSEDSVKNYRLDATMTVTRQSYGWFNNHDEYSDIQGSWPNGGTLELSGCVVKEGSQSECQDQDGKSYGIEVETSPEPPDTSNDN